MTDTQPDDDQLILRKVDHPHAANAYRVVWRGIEVGSIGMQVGSSRDRSGVLTPLADCSSNAV